MAASLALDDCGFTSQGKREPLRALLTGRERDSGLGSTEREQDEEIALEAAELEAGGPVVPAEPEPGSTQAIRQDAQRTVSELEDRRRRLSPEALTDKAARAELTSIESEIGEARSLLDLVDTAQGEIDRRTREAVEAARRAAIERSEATAQALQPEIRRAAERIDTVAGTLAECVSAYAALKGQQAAAIAGTDRGQEAVRARSYRPAEVSSALFVALRERGVEIAGVDGTNRSKPLAVAEPEAL
jgi:chromosome segregation ATPase